MNNLKRVLSLALASVMLIGMMAVSASATSFSDDADIENKAAVGTMVALNIISGYPDGSYQPDGLLTRAEAAKMIFVALNGGKTSDNLTTKTVPTFTDIKGNWAEGYIEWAAAEKQGIIAGMGDGTFNPKGNLTGTQLSKMMLVAIGYDAKAEGLEGTSDWALNTNSLALGKGFFEGLDDLDPEANITRDQAALLILNACNATMVKYSSYLQTNNGNLSSTLVAEEYADQRTILTNKYEATTRTNLYLSAVTYNSTTEKYTYTFTTAADGTGTAWTTTTKEDFTSLYAQPVSVVAKYGTAPTITTFYGAFSRGTVKSTVWGDLTVTASTKSVKVDGTSFKANAAGTAAIAGLTTYSGTSTATAATLGAGSANTDFASVVTFVDANSDGVAEYAIVDEKSVEKVTYVSKTTATIGSENYTLADITVYDGIAKGDYAVVHTNDFTEDVDVVKADSVKGKITAVKDTNSVQIDGTWYKKAATFALTAANIGDTYELAVVNGYYYAGTKDNTVSTSNDILFISDAENAALKLGVKTAEAKAYFTDGTSANITISQLNGVKLGSVSGYGDKGLTAANGMQNTNYGNSYITEGALYTYTVLSDGTYNLTALADTDGYRAGYSFYDQDDLSGTTVGYIAKNNTGYFTDGTTDYSIADDAVIFVVSDTTVKVMDGKAVKTWTNATLGTPTAMSLQILGGTVNGYPTAKVAAVVGDWGAVADDSTKLFGYVVSANPVVETNSDNAKVANITVWNGTENVDIQVIGIKSGAAVGNGTVADESTTANKYGIFAKGKFVRYELDSKGYATEFETYGQALAVSALDGNNLKLKAGTAAAVDYTINSDTKYIYVDVANSKGIEGGELTMATATEVSTVYFNNIVTEYSFTPLAPLSVVFVDISNKVEGAGSAVAKTATTDSGYSATYFGVIDLTSDTKTAAIISNSMDTVTEMKATLVYGTNVMAGAFKNVLSVRAEDASGNAIADGTTLVAGNKLFLLGTNGIETVITLTSVAV